MLWKVSSSLSFFKDSFHFLYFFLGNMVWLKKIKIVFEKNEKYKILFGFEFSLSRKMVKRNIIKIYITHILLKKKSFYDITLCILYKFYLFYIFYYYYFISLLYFYFKII